MKYLFYIYLLLVLVSCTENQEMPDKPYNGTISIAVDENYTPAIKEEVRLFTTQYDSAHINAQYINELECVKQFYEKKLRMILIPRPPTSQELEYAKENGMTLSFMALAKDGLAFIVSDKAPKKNFTTDEIEKILSDQDAENYTIVFDDNNSSNAFYVKDSILRGRNPNKNSYSAQGLQSLIKYVGENPKSIGVVGMNPIYNADSSVKSLLNQVELVGIKTDTSEYYFKPYTMYIATKSYPYAKYLNFILNESWQGTGHSFANYLGSQGGQLLLSKYHLFPLLYNIINREFQITDDPVF